ncbi:TPA: hypothetical protein ACN359_002083 [Vibrio parahaemolyticus]
MKFVKEDLLTYIKRTVEENNLDPSNRKITRVELSPSEWSELAASVRPNRSNPHCIRLALNTMLPYVRTSSPFSNCHYDEVEIVMVRNDQDEDF